jgi:hypothetical protein
MSKAPHLDMGVVVFFSEIFNRPATIEEAREILAQYKREAVLLVLAKLSAGLRIWFRPDYQKDNGLARDVFKNARRAEAHSMPGNPRRLFFTRLGVLATARLALSACDRPEASEITEPQQAARVMACCLMMNELTSSTAPLVGVADLLVHQLANHNAMAHFDFRADLLRSLEIFERNRALLDNQPGTVDLEVEFRRATGLTPRQFIELCLVIGTPYRMMDAGSLISDDPSFFIDKNRFANIKIGDAELTSFLDTVAQTARNLGEYLPTRGERPLADATVFQAWPIIREEGTGRYYCCDLASLMDKTGRGLYWTLFGAADARTKGRLGGTYGHAFEAYLHDRVRRTGFARDSYIDSPKFSDGAEVCDGLFIEGSRIILGEYKSSVLTAEAKLSGRLDLLEPDLRKKFVTGDADGRKGIAQLSHSIERILKGEPVIGLPSTNWTILQPVMVCLESAMLCPGMSGYLNAQFDRARLRKRSRMRVAPLTLIDIEHFEDLLPDMSAFGFGTLLEDYYGAHMRSAGGRHDQLVAFRRKNIPFLEDKPEPPDEKEAAFRRFFADLGARLFEDTK